MCPMQDVQQRCNHSRHMSHGQRDGHDVQLQCRILRGRGHMLSVSAGDIFQLCRRRAHCVARRSAGLEAKAVACGTASACVKSCISTVGSQHFDTYAQ